MPPMYKYSSIFLCNLFLVSNRLFVQPKAKHLSFRKIPLKQFRLLGRVSLGLSIILALMVVPTTITMASAYRALSNDYALWESLTDAVSIFITMLMAYTRKNGSRRLKAFLQRWQTKIIFACRLRLTEKFYLIKVKWVNTIIYGSHKPNTHHIQISLGDHGRIPSGLPCGHIRPSIAVRHHRRPENTPQRHRTACGVWRGYCQRPQGSEPLPCGDPSL